jgi:TetR/AcrR family transcriptional regulator, transcriptional repressor for nem operon
MPRPATDKRQRLVTAAIEQFHRQGYKRTSLADVAKSAGISAGNVFYYFKAKDDLALAVIDEWCSLLSGYLVDLESDDDAWKRLEAFVHQARLMRDIYVTLGCPLAGLTRDLRQESDALKDQVARIYATQFRWLEKEFHRGGVSKKHASSLSRTLMAAYHGSILLAFVQSDASLIDDEVDHLTAWLHECQKRTLQKS